MPFGSGNSFEKHCGVVEWVLSARKKNSFANRKQQLIESYKNWLGSEHRVWGSLQPDIKVAQFSELSDQEQYEPKPLSPNLPS